jgi:superfamily I DNA/RNA helicase
MRHLFIDEAQDTSPQQWQIALQIVRVFFDQEANTMQNLPEIHGEFPYTTRFVNERIPGFGLKTHEPPSKPSGSYGRDETCAVSDEPPSKPSGSYGRDETCAVSDSKLRREPGFVSATSCSAQQGSYLLEERTPSARISWPSSDWQEHSNTEPARQMADSVGWERKPTIFVVGDVKQSIYSFQGAKPWLFSSLMHVFEELMNNTEFPTNSSPTASLPECQEHVGVACMSTCELEVCPMPQNSSSKELRNKHSAAGEHCNEAIAPTEPRRKSHFQVINLQTSYRTAQTVLNVVDSLFNKNPRGIWYDTCDSRNEMHHTSARTNAGFVLCVNCDVCAPSTTKKNKRRETSK